MSAHKWQFSSRFRRHAFGWRSDTPIQRIKEALAEIKQVARKEPLLAAEGAVTLLEKLSPALEQVDSSSGALGSAVNKAIETLVSIIVKADVDASLRQRWMERLWQALQDDEMPYIELLGDYWGELCVTPELAGAWADEFLPVVERVWSPQASGHGFFKGTSACLASLYAAGRHEELLALIDKAPFKWWHNRRWVVKALAAQGKKAEAIRYAEESRGRNDPGWQIAQACEEILLLSGLAEEAYLMAAVPRSTIIGFTGTPIARTSQGEGTFKIFGAQDELGYLDKYSIAESIADETTLPIKHVMAPSTMTVPTEQLDKEFFALADSEGVTDVEELNKVLDRAVGLRTFRCADDRIEKVAAFVAEHFQESVLPLGYKAFLVAVTCSSAGTVTLASDLVEQDESFQDYVIVHELLHLRFSTHGKMFKALMSAHVPGWRRWEVVRRGNID